MNNTLHRLITLCEDKKPPKLVSASATSEGDMRIIIRTDSGDSKVYNYQNVPYAVPTANDMKRLASRKNKKWLTTWRWLDQYRIKDSDPSI